MVCPIDKALDLMARVAEINANDPLRKGNLIVLPHFGQVVMTGDMHGFRANFEKLKVFADLDRCPDRHVVLHELIHTSVNGDDVAGDEDQSCQLLLAALEWKLAYPAQVHFIMGNHDLAQITDREITKSGGASIAAFNQWVCQEFSKEGLEILERVRALLATFSLAVRCPNRIWLSHSLPSPYAMEDYDITIFTRTVRPVDLLPKGSVYELVWGRNHTAEQLDRLAKLLDVDYFIVGHQNQPSGCGCAHEREIILASDHHRGCFLPIDLSRQYAFDELMGRLRYFHEITWPENVGPGAASCT